MSKTSEELLAAGNVFLELSDEVDRELVSSGFNPSKEPPGTEPTLPANVSRESDDRVKELYDNFLVFYNYLSDRIAQTTVYLGLTKQRVSVVEAQIVLEAGTKKSELHNAELRKAYVTSHPALIAAQKDYLYFKQTVDAQNTRLKKLSKSMDRLYRELMIRQPQYSPGTHSRENSSGYRQPERPKRKHTYKQVRPGTT